MTRPGISERTILRRMVHGLVALGLLAVTSWPAEAKSDSHFRFKHIPTQFIAALGDPNARSGSGAEDWGLWRRDPGPRGVWLRLFDQLQAAGGVTPAKWTFDEKDWWMEENGLIMEKPDFPVPPGRYLVTGDREVVTVLTVHPTGADGSRKWELHNGAKLYDVTHLPCRSARYTPATPGSCSPAKAIPTQFPVTPGGPMPDVEGCRKQDYAVLFVIGVAVGN